MHRSNAGWWVAFVAVVLVGLSIILLNVGQDPEPPPVGVDPSELVTEPPRPPKEPGDATVEVEIIASRALLNACLMIPTAVRVEDREPCVKDTRELRRRVRVKGPIMSAWAGAMLGPNGGSVSCRILVDGEARHTASAEGPYHGAYCTVIAKVP